MRVKVPPFAHYLVVHSRQMPGEKQEIYICTLFVLDFCPVRRRTWLTKGVA